MNFTRTCVATPSLRTIELVTISQQKNALNMQMKNQFM